MSQEIYNKTVFKRFFEENDPAVMEWAENVLEKVSSPGILPTFIKKDGEDFKAYWETVCHIFALVVLYAKQYNEIDTNKILFELFIENRGLVTDEVNTLEQMKYLFNNYVKEYRKRGTLDIVNKEGAILGELLRLIRYKTEDEFIFALLMSRDTGWTMGHSSPTWNRTDTVLNVTKGYETTESVKDLNAYPLVNPTGVVIVDDIDNNGTPIQVMTFVGNALVGISSEIDKTKLLPISENLSYQISFKVKTSSTSNQNLKFGVEVFNEAVQPMICKESYGSAESNNFVSGSKGILELPVAGVYYECRAILSRKNRAYAKQLELNFSKGRGLQMKDGMKFLSLSLTQDRSNSSALVYIYDIKIKPLFLPFYQGNLGEKDVIAAYYLNNSLTSEEGVKGFTEDYLVTYKNIMGSEDIQPLKEKNVIFKVSSDRGAYIEGASISILDKRLVTDRNGEASIVLYPGDYSIDVEKSLFMNIEDRLFQVLEDDEETQVEYIQMQGDVYERKVTFVVRDENERPIQNALVTFNGEFKYTDSSGNAIFMAFPGLYPYTVSKTDYYTISKNINVQDDQSEPVTLILIPRYTVTFTVTNSSTGTVEGANISIGNNAVITNDNGQAIIQLANGQYEYIVSASGYIPVEGMFVVLNGSVFIDVQMVLAPHTVTFHVTDEKGGVVPYANVMMDNRITTTNSQGVASLSARNGNYPYTIEKLGYDEYSGSVVVDGRDKEVYPKLEFKVWTITVIVKDKENQLIPNVIVKVNNGEYLTNQHGEAEIPLVNGEYPVTIEKTGYDTLQGEIKVNNQNADVTFEMDFFLYNVEFNISQVNQGNPAEGATIKIEGQPGVLNVNGSGQATIKLKSGNYSYTIQKKGYDDLTGSFNVEGQDTFIQRTLVLKHYSVVITVLDSDNSSLVQGAAVNINGSSYPTNDRGQVVVSLQNGTYPYTATKSGYYDGSSSVTVLDSDNSSAISLKARLYNVIMTVKNPLQEPINGATVEINATSYQTQSNGQVSLQLKNGTYPFTVTALGMDDYSGGLVQQDT